MKKGIHVDEDDNDDVAEGMFVAEEEDLDDAVNTELPSDIVCWECCCCCCWFSIFLPLVTLWLLELDCVG